MSFAIPIDDYDIDNSVLTGSIKIRDILYYIFDFFDPKELILHLPFVSHKWREICDDKLKQLTYDNNYKKIMDEYDNKLISYYKKKVDDKFDSLYLTIDVTPDGYYYKGYNHNGIVFLY